MPQYPYKPFDPAAAASKLPRPLQRSGGFLLDLLGQLTGADGDTPQVPTVGAFFPPRMPRMEPQGQTLGGAFKTWGKGLEKAYPHLYGPSHVPPPPPGVGDAFNQYRELLLQMLQRGK